MTRPTFGQPLPPDVVVVVPTRAPTSCAVPHHDRDGAPKVVLGRVYRTSTGDIVLCAAHGKARFGL